MKTYLFATFTDYQSGKLTGAHRRYLELIEGLSRQNKVIVYSKGIPQLHLNGNIEMRAIEVPRLVRYLPNHVRAIICTRRALRKDRNLSYDYAVAFGAANVLSFKYSKIRPVSALFREDLIGYRAALGTKGMKLLYFKWIERASVVYARQVIVQCQADRQQLIARNRSVPGIENRVFIQCNNVNASWMKRQQVVNHKQEDDVATVLFIGHFSNARKGHGLLLPAVERLINEGSRIRLLVAGDGAEMEAYRARYGKLSDVEFLGRVSDVMPLFERASFLVVPSLIDSCPNTVLEGLNAGVAVYGSNSGGIPDLLQDQRYLFEPDAESIYSFLKQVIADKRYIQDAKDQRARAQELRFDWSDKIEALIEDGHR